MNNENNAANKNLVEINEILANIGELGYTVKHKYIDDTYFIFQDEGNSICNFEIKELKGFMFGLWNTNRFDNIGEMYKRDMLTWADSLEISSKSQWVFFVQYKRDIDKFKPSCSSFVTGICKYERGWDMSTIESILFYIKRHPIKCAQYSGIGIKYIWDQKICSIRILFDFCYDWIWKWNRDRKYNLHTKNTIKTAKNLCKHLKDCDIIITDMGNCWNPRINFFIDTSNSTNVRDLKKFLKGDSYKYWDDINFIETSFKEIDLKDETIIYKKIGGGSNEK